MYIYFYIIKLFFKNCINLDLNNLKKEYNFAEELRITFIS